MRTRIILCVALMAALQLACAFPTTRQAAPPPAPAQPGSASPTAALPPAGAPTPALGDTPAAAPPPRPPYLIGYFNGGDPASRVEDIQGGLLTDIIYAHIAISPQGGCAFADPPRDRQNLAGLRQLRERYPGLRLHMSVGARASRFSEIAAAAETRRAFARSCVDLLRQEDLHGIDIDWEFPGRGGRAADRANFPALLAELRARLDELGGPEGRAYLLTFAAPSGENERQHFDLGQAAPLVDWINLMTYDFYDERSLNTNFNSALYGAADDPSHSPYNAAAVTQAYLDAGVPREKLVIGAVFYGLGWRGVAAEQNGLYQPAGGPFEDAAVPPETWNAEGKVSYRALAAYYLGAPGWQSYWSAAAQAPWLYNAQAGGFISYENEESLAAKADYALANQLGGVMFWQIGADAPGSPLLKALAARLLGR